MSIEVSEPFSIRRVIDRARGLFRKQPALFLGLTAGYVLAPHVAVGLITVYAPDFPEVLTNIVLAVCSLIGKLAMIVAALALLAGKRIEARQATARGMAFFWPAVGVGLVSNIGIGLGLVLLIVPGLFLMTLWAVALPALVASGKGVGAALSESVERTKGSRWPVFGLMLLAAAAYFGATFVLIVMSRGSFEVVFTSQVVLLPVLVSGLELVTCLALPAMYQELKHRSGGELEQTADVFA